MEDASRSMYDAFAVLVADACDAPVGIVTLLERSGAWGEAFVACDPEVAGLTEAHVFNDAPLAAGSLVVTRTDWGAYVGLPLVTRDGRTIATLAAMDVAGRSFSDDARAALEAIGMRLVAAMEAPATAAGWSADEIALLGRALEHVADPIAIFQRGDEGVMPCFVYVNRAFGDLFGYTLAEVAGKEPKILAGPETSADVRGKILAKQGTAPIDYGTVALYTSTGRRLLVELVTHHVSDTYRSVSYRDVTRERAAQAELLDAGERLRSLISKNSDAILTFDAGGRCTDTNAAAETMFGLSRSALLGQPFRAITVAGERNGVDAALAAGHPVSFTSRIRHAGGRSLTVECDAIPIAVRGVLDGTYVFVRDVSEPKRVASLVRKQAERASALCAVAALVGRSDSEQIDAVLELVCASFEMDWGYVAEIVGPNYRFTNGAGDAIYGRDELVDRAEAGATRVLDYGDVVTIEDLSAPHPLVVSNERYAGWHGYVSTPLYVAGAVHGAVGFASRSVRPFDDADRDFIRIVASFVSSALERRHQQRRLEQLAYFDDLTGLANRARFTRRLEAEIAKPANAFALHFVDLDGFKTLNDRYGHAAGDLALREASRRLERLCRRHDMPARLGGDEFVVLQFDRPSHEDARAFGARVVESLSKPYDLDGATFALGASVGVARFPQHGCRADTLMRRADAALYRAKAGGRHRVEIEPDGGPAPATSQAI